MASQEVILRLGGGGGGCWWIRFNFSDHDKADEKLRSIITFAFKLTEASLAIVNKIKLAPASQLPICKL